MNSMEEIKLENELRLCDVKKQNLRQTMEKIKSTASDVLILNLQWCDLEDDLISSREMVEKRYMEVVSKEDELRKRSLALEERVKVVEAAEAEMVDLEMKANAFRSEVEEKGEELERKMKDLTKILDKIAVCGKQLELAENQLDSQQNLLESRSSELVKIQTEVEMKRKQVEQMDFVLQKHRGENIVELEHLHRSQNRNRELDEEIERKKEDFTSRIVEYEKQLKSVEEQLASQQELLEKQSLELDVEIERKKKDFTSRIVEYEKQLKSVEEQVASQQELLEKQSLELVCIKQETTQQLKSKNKELEEIERLIQERTDRNESIELLLKERNEELASKEKRQNEMTEAIHKLSLEIVCKETAIQLLSEKQNSKQKKLDLIDAEFVLKEKELCSVKDTYRECLQNLETQSSKLRQTQDEVESKGKQLEQMDFVLERHRGELSAVLEHLNRSQTRNRELEEETERKMKDLKTILDQITDRGKQLELSENKIASQQKQLEILSLELVSKKKEFDGVNLDLDLANSLNDELKETSQQIKSKEKELEDIERLLQERTGQNESIKLLLEEHSGKLASKEKRQNEITEGIQKLSLEIVSKEKTIQKLSEKQHSKQKKLDLICAEYVLKEKELCSVKDTYRECLQNWEIKKEELKSLEEEVKKIKEISNDFQAKEVEQVKLKAALMERVKELVRKEKQFRDRSENIELKEKKLDAWEERLNKKDEQLKSAEQKVAKCVKDYELKAKKLASFCQQNKPSEAPIRNSSDSCSPDFQENTASSHLGNEDALLEPEGSAFFSPNEIVTAFQNMDDPAGCVLNLVNDELMDAQRRGESSLTEPIVKNLVSLLEELIRVRGSSEHLPSDASQVAHRWSRMLGHSSQMSPLDAWGFLQFLVAYGLVHRTNRDNTLRFAMSIVHFKQAPKLFESLGLSYAIKGLVTQLLDNRNYLLAIRFILYFNLNHHFNSLKFLKDEIVTLRLSAKDKGRFHSQAEDRDAAKLKDIIELIDEFKLEVDLPVELIVKFMVPREVENQNPYVVSSFVPVQPPQLSFPTSLGGSPAQQVLQLETYPKQAGDSTVVHGQSSHQTGFKRPRVDPSVSEPVIRP